MGRQLRIEYKNALYHIMSHGNGKQWLYKNYSHLELFISLLRKIVLKYQVIIHAFVLMRNHYHILLETPKANLIKAMKYFNQEYGRCYNVIEKRKGGIFRDRYKAILVEKEKYYFNVLKYIAQNPKKIGLVEKCENYSGSFLNKELEKEVDLILHTAKIKSYFNNSSNWKEKYYSWLNEGIESDPMEEQKYKYFLGTEKWIEKFKIDNKKKLPRNVLERKKYYKIKINEKLLIKQLNKKKISKKLALYLYFKYTELTMRELKTKLKLSSVSSGYQMVYRMKKKELENQDFQVKLKTIEEKFVKC